MKLVLVRNRLIIICAFIVVLLTINVYPVTIDREEFLYKNKNYTEAKSSLLKKLPKLKGRERNRGLFLLAKLETDVYKTEKIYQEIIHFGNSKERLRAKLELAKIYYSLSNYKEVTEVLDIIPERANYHDIIEAHFYLGMSWKELGGIENARYNLEKIDRGPFLYWSYIYLAELNMQEGKIEKAVEGYESIASEHYNPIAGFKLGECYEILGDRNRAVKVYRTLASKFPYSPEAPKAQEKIQKIRYAEYEKNRVGYDYGGEDGGNYEDSRREDEGFDSYRFTLQFGAFRLRENAIKLSAKLREYLDDVRVERAVYDGKTWYRVRVGRFANREEAEKKSNHVMRDIGYSSKIIPLQKYDY